MADDEKVAFEPYLLSVNPLSAYIAGLMTCVECGALVGAKHTWQHQNWHQQVDNLPKVQESIERYDEAIAFMRYWIDGLHILLGEEPVFNPPRKIPTDYELERWRAPEPLFEDDEEPF